MNKNIVIGILLAAILILGYLQFQQKAGTTSPTAKISNVQTNNGSYNGSRFSFDYPKKYILTENKDEIRITSVPIPKVDNTKCQHLEDEQARAYCLNPASKLSPNIAIKFIPGSPNDLWKTMTYNSLDEWTFIANDQYTYKTNYISGEFGGRGMYGLFLPDGLLVATYSYEDSEGGVQFDSLKSSEYKLNNTQQKELLEQILSSLKVK